MKKLLSLLSIVAFTLSAQAQKTATINMDQTFLKYYKTINAEKRLKKQVRLMEDRAVQMEKKHKATVAAYEKLITESARCSSK